MISAAEKDVTEVEVEETGSIFSVEVTLVMLELSIRIDREDIVKASVIISIFPHVGVVAVDAEDVFATDVVEAIS